ncbi:unnamed protein product [Ixodes pacificus]
MSDFFDGVKFALSTNIEHDLVELGYPLLRTRGCSPPTRRNFGTALWFHPFVVEVELVGFDGLGFVLFNGAAVRAARLARMNARRSATRTVPFEAQRTLFRQGSVQFDYFLGFGLPPRLAARVCRSRRVPLVVAAAHSPVVFAGHYRGRDARREAGSHNSSHY